MLSDFPLELVYEIFSYCDVADLVLLGSTSHSYAICARKYLKFQMNVSIRRTFVDVEAFHQMLHSCDVVVSGSTALHILLPAKTTTWIPADLDIYVPFIHFRYMAMLLEQQGFQLFQDWRVNSNPYLFSSIHSIVSFANRIHCVDVIVSQTDMAICPVLQFHSMAVMNFFGVDHIFCAYPALTFQFLSRVNPGPLYFGQFHSHNFSALWKYAHRGFQYTSCDSGHGSKYLCKSIVCNLTDAGCLWVDLNHLPWVSVTLFNMFQHYGFMDVQWLLGGMVCGSKYAFVDAHMHVFEDQSCVNLTSELKLHKLIR